MYLCWEYVNHELILIQLSFAGPKGKADFESKARN